MAPCLESHPKEQRTDSSLASIVKAACNAIVGMTRSIWGDDSAADKIISSGSTQGQQLNISYFVEEI